MDRLLKAKKKVDTTVHICSLKSVKTPTINKIKGFILQDKEVESYPYEGTGLNTKYKYPPSWTDPKDPSLTKTDKVKKIVFRILFNYTKEAFKPHGLSNREACIFHIYWSKGDVISTFPKPSDRTSHRVILHFGSEEKYSAKVPLPEFQVNGKSISNMPASARRRIKANTPSNVFDLKSCETAILSKPLVGGVLTAQSKFSVKTIRKKKRGGKKNRGRRNKASKIITAADIEDKWKDFDRITIIADFQALHGEKIELNPMPTSAVKIKLKGGPPKDMNQMEGFVKDVAKDVVNTSKADRKRKAYIESFNKQDIVSDNVDEDLEDIIDMVDDTDTKTPTNGKKNKRTIEFVPYEATKNSEESANSEESTDLVDISNGDDLLEDSDGSDEDLDDIIGQIEG